jgi:acyl transferase domain-containing protein
MFSGQGSQFFNMGRELFAKNKVFREHMLHLDSLASAVCGNSILDEVFDDNQIRKPFLRLRYSHPALFITQLSLAYTVMDLGIRPSFVIGASLGGIVSAVVAGAIAMTDALNAVCHQAMVLEEACEVGVMIAVLAPESAYRNSSTLMALSDLAAVNSPETIVISTNARNAPLTTRALAALGLDWVTLDVGHPFHSRWLDPIGDRLMSAGRVLPRKSNIPIVCCEAARLITEIPQDYLWILARGAINLRGAILALEQHTQGIYVDLSPSGTMATIVKHNLPVSRRAEVHMVLSRYSCFSSIEALQSLRTTAEGIV